MPTFDNRLVEWVVKPGDPAAKAVSTLRRHGFETIVLPRALYMGYDVETIREMPDPGDKNLVFRIREVECVSLLKGD